MKLKTAFAGLMALLMLTGLARAEWKPSGPVTLEIGFDAGGETDTLGRVIAKEMADQTGWTMVVKNKPGGGGIAMFTTLAVAKPDGQTIGMGVNMPILVNLVLRGDKLPFKLDSFDYLATVARAQVALVAKKDAPFNDLKGLVDYSKSHEGTIVSFDAKPQELLMRFVNKQAGADIKLISTKSSAESIQEVLGGHVIAAFAAGAHIPYLESGDLKMIASANATRHSYAPDAQTVTEQGFDIFVDPYFFIAAPKGLPADAKDALAKALDKAINSDATRKAIVNALKTDPSDLGPDGTEKMLVDGVQNVKKLFDK
ncbi:MAG: tripartite tricarboxylate transporter substrate binding protein [Alphaproteobacteria bacterium]|nr:MAG: tripartite tricarboxylate transporter substrate binding protein [Alphaproteobacteria bacterium]